MRWASRETRISAVIDCWMTFVSVSAAAKNQLERLYTRDPNAQGYGVYLVFYFGPGRERKITSHPEKISLADSPDELEKALNAAVPPEHRNGISCAVIDVSPPALPRSRAPKAKGKEIGGKAAPRARTKNPSRARKSSDTKTSKPKGAITKRTTARKAPNKGR